MTKRIFHPSGDRHYSRARPELVKRGTDAPGAKLSDAERRAIVELGAVPGANFTRIGRLFGVSRQTIWRVLRGV